jgi:hypothetical protein
MVRLAVLGGMYADGEDSPVPSIPDGMADKIFRLMEVFDVHPSEMYPGAKPEKVFNGVTSRAMVSFSIIE